MNPRHLLEQAERLASEGKGRPRQSDLRRAVSTAYYAIFHLLTQECSRRITTVAELRPLIARTLNHSEMKKVAAAFANNQLSEDVRSALTTITISTDLQLVARTFAKRQESRHTADYDSRSDSDFSRQDALAEVRRAREAFAVWERIRNDEEVEIFLIAFVFHGRWGR